MFFDKVDLELKRAERYSVFVSIIVVDLQFLKEYFGPASAGEVKKICELIEKGVRVIDHVSTVDDLKIGLLFPETPRQGAEIAGRRVSEIVRDYLSKTSDAAADRVIPLEMASFPDAAGARTISDLLRDYADSARN